MRIESDIVSRPSFRRYTFHFANRPNGQNKNRRKRRIGIAIVFCVSGTKQTATDDANDLRMRVYCVYPNNSKQQQQQQRTKSRCRNH